MQKLWWSFGIFVLSTGCLYPQASVGVQKFPLQSAEGLTAPGMKIEPVNYSGAQLHSGDRRRQG